MGRRFHTFRHPGTQHGFIHHGRIDALQPIILPTQHFLEEPDLGAGKCKVRRRGAIATESTFAMSPNSRASCAAASPRTPTILDSPSPARWAARSVTRSLSRSAAGTIARPTAPATSARGGSRPASTRSRSPAGYGRQPTDGGSGDLNRDYLGRRALPRPLTQRQKAGDISATATTQDETRLPDLPG